ncbi:MAG: hypothetical protein R2810_04850 [Flavobacteriales bacterium]
MLEFLNSLRRLIPIPLTGISEACSTGIVVNCNAFDALTSQGIEIIANDSLRRLITNLYSFHYHNTDRLREAG